LAKVSPDPSIVGDRFARMEMIRREYNVELAKTQSKIAAVLNTNQATLVGSLLNVVRLQPLVSEANCVSLASRYGSFAIIATSGFVTPIGTGILGFPMLTQPSVCQTGTFPAALANYLKLTDAQIVTIENAITANQDYLSRQSLKTAELQLEVKDLTASETIDSAKLGAAYIAMKQIQNDESVQSGQLAKTVRSVLTEQQISLMQALDDAAGLYYTAASAVNANILVLPANLQSGACGSPLMRQGDFASFLLGYATFTGTGVCWYNSSGFYSFGAAAEPPAAARPGYSTQLLSMMQPAFSPGR
jgi:hypothetical protein